MPVIITSTTDSPEDVASAMGAELEVEEPVVETETLETEIETKTEEEIAAEAAAAKAAAEAEVEEPGESETDHDDKKKPTGYKRKALRLEAELTREREEKKLLLDMMKKEGISAAAEGEEEETIIPGKDTVQTYSGVPEPKFEDFKDDPDQYKAFTIKYAAWSKNEAVAQVRAEQQQIQMEAQRQADIRIFNARLADTRKADGIYADYDEVLESIKGQDLPVTPLMQGLMMTAKSKDGTPLSVDIMYYLASHPDECREIAVLPEAEIKVEMGIVKYKALIETERRTAELASKKSKIVPKSKADDDGEEKPAVVVKAVVKPKSPPPPIKPVGKRAAPQSQDLETVAASGSFKDYESRRKAQGFKYK